MKKISYIMIAALLLSGTAAMMSDTGVVVHKKDGTKIFYPEEDVDFVEFSDNYTPETPSDPSEDEGNDGYWTPSQALSKIASGFEGEATVKGYIISIEEISTTYGNATYTIADEATDTKGLYVYRGYYLNGDKFTSSSQIKVGDLVVVEGNLVNYNGVTPEFTTGSTIISHTGGSSNNGGQGNSDQGETEVPAEYKYPLSYVALPAGTPQQVKEYTSFTVNFNKDNHTPNYVAWELLSSETSGSVSTSRNYWVDSSVEGCLSTDFGYSTYGYERGHMCPAAENKWSSAAMKDCAVMTNMCPQLSSLNGKIWSTLEDKERSWASKLGSIWIVAGPVYDSTDTLYVGDAKARVPSAFFKAFLYYNGTNSKAIAFVFVNGENAGNLQNYAMSIDDLEIATGYDFFSALPDDIETAVEASFNYSDWN